MRILLLIITFAICYIVDPLPVNDISCSKIMQVESAQAIKIDFELLFNAIRIYTY